MTTYNIQLCYAWITVEADSKEEAENKALSIADSCLSDHGGICATNEA